MIPPAYSETPVVQPQPVYPPYPQQPAQPEVNPNVAQAYIVTQPLQVGYANGCTQIFYTCSPAPMIYTNYKAGQSKFLGIAQIIIGILCIAFNATGIGVSGYNDSGLSFVGIGIWAGIFFIITGSFGVGAGAKKSRCLVITFMVFCIISAVAAGVILILSAISVALSSDECNNSYYYDGYGRYHTNYGEIVCPDQHAARLAMYCLLLILSVFESVFAIWGSVNCCKVACCGAKRQDQYSIQPQPVMLGSMNGNQQVIVLTTPNMASQGVVNPGYQMNAAPMYHPAPQAAYPQGTFVGVPPSSPPYQSAPQPMNFVAGDMNQNPEEKRDLSG